jgi:7,8-dihydropterin-6-yl-methyl-4-(beta-D-ribofuranosyl)aminobenzene 5'-phosphate synthase
LSDELYAITPFEADPEMPREKTVLFYEKNGDLYEDFNPGEVVLVIKGSKGLVILAGCSHIGVVSIIEKIKKLFNENIYAFIGGTHLKGESDTYIKKAAEYFKTSEIQKIGVCHCTGEAAEKIFNESLKERFFKVTTGSRIVL